MYFNEQIKWIFSGKKLNHVLDYKREQPMLISKLIEGEIDYPHYELEIYGEKIRVIVSLQRFETEEDLIYYQNVGKDIYVFLNENYELFEKKELPTCAKIGVAEAIAKYIISKNKITGDILEIRNNILRTLNFKIKTQIEKERIKERLKRIEREKANLKAKLDTE